MTQPTQPETDSRFPSGKWVGFFLDRRMPGRHSMELTLHFADGRMTGSGCDRVGTFTVEGAYDIKDGQCLWIKEYIKAHLITYRGFNEGKGIWGTWELAWQGLVYNGGFHIWPEGMSDPTVPVIEEEADVPIEVDVTEEELLPLGK
jgi:hypothetical protein